MIAGEHQPPFVHALAHAMNAALGNVGKTVVYTESIEANPVNQLESLRDLVNDLNAGKVEFLVILGANPVYDAPADFDFADRASESEDCAFIPACIRTKRRSFATGTAPAAHYLESWSDGRAYDGTVGIVQPLIAPLYEAHSAHEIIALLRAMPANPATSWFATTGRASVRKRTRHSKRSGKHRCTMASWPAPRCPRFPLRRTPIS